MSNKCEKSSNVIIILVSILIIWLANRRLIAFDLSNVPPDTNENQYNKWPVLRMRDNTSASIFCFPGIQTQCSSKLYSTDKLKTSLRWCTRRGFRQAALFMAALMVMLSVWMTTWEFVQVEAHRILQLSLPLSLSH